jgi:hypothetical protein
MTEIHSALVECRCLFRIFDHVCVSKLVAAAEIKARLGTIPGAGNVARGWAIDATWFRDMFDMRFKIEHIGIEGYDPSNFCLPVLQCPRLLPDHAGGSTGVTGLTCIPLVTCSWQPDYFGAAQSSMGTRRITHARRYSTTLMVYLSCENKGDGCTQSH